MADATTLAAMSGAGTPPCASDDDHCGESKLRIGFGSGSSAVSSAIAAPAVVHSRLYSGGSG